MELYSGGPGGTFNEIINIIFNFPSTEKQRDYQCRYIYIDAIN